MKTLHETVLSGRVPAPPEKRFLAVSPDGHFLQYADGTPFFYLADTAWMLVNKLTEAEARRLFEDRSRKGFTAIQSVVFRDLFESNTANALGIHPFASETDLRSARLDPRWIETVVRITHVAAEYGLVMAWLPTWGDKWNEHSNSAGPVVMDEHSAEGYCRTLSDALGECANVIWVLGGDSPIRTQRHANIVRAMAHGLRAGASRDRLIGYHPSGEGSSAIFYSEAWLDFNTMRLRARSCRSGFAESQPLGRNPNTAEPSSPPTPSTWTGPARRTSCCQS